jgi:selenocysteine lyase/cysteine desulfurase
MLTQPIDVFAGLRSREFARLDAHGLIYLDYAGAALYPASLVRRDARRLSERVLGNPHSESGPSRISTEAIDVARRLTLRLLDADPSVYDVVFTANATAAIRVLAEAFPFREGSRLVLTADNHNSVNGLRVRAARRRAAVSAVPLDAALRTFDPCPWLTVPCGPSLFAFPAQSNFSGVRHPLEWVRTAQERGYRVLLDAAAFLPTKTLSLSDVPADFVALSFYKLFGYPTGVGALVARRDALAMLRRRYFGGGSVQFVSVQNGIARVKRGGERFEDGTPNFLAMPAVADGLRWLRRVGLWRSEQHVATLTRMTLGRFANLGDRFIVYGPSATCDRGGTIAFNLRRNGRVLPYEEVEAAACERGIAIRGGCFCNPGAAERAFDIPAGRAAACLRGRFTVPRFRACLDGPPVGALRASIGIPTTPADIDALIEFIDGLTRAEEAEAAETISRGDRRGAEIR